MTSGPLPSPDPGLDEAAALRRRLAVLETVLGESTDPIFNILEDGTYRYVNQAFSGPFGHTPEEVVGQRIWDLFSPDEAGKRMAVVRRAFATGELIVFDVRVPTPAGDTYYITSVKPIMDGAGKVTSVVCISKDITARKRAEQEVRTLTGLLPICAHCKKIRDDHGYWTQLEQYLRAHSQAEFTHGICPECQEHYFNETL